jgi:hypothetical protein
MTNFLGFNCLLIGAIISPHPQAHAILGMASISAYRRRL